MAGAGEAQYPWLEQVDELASRLPADEEADFKHRAYLGAVAVVVEFLDGDSLGSEGHDADTAGTRRLLDWVKTRGADTSPGSPAPNSFYRIEVPAGLEEPEDPSRIFWLSRLGAFPEKGRGLWPISGAGHLFLPSAWQCIRRLDVTADNSALPIEFRLAIASTRQQRAMDRSAEALEGFGKSLGVVIRALGVELPEPDIVMLFAV